MSYDSVADTYQRVAVPWFAALADDLIAAAKLRPGEHVLDVGTGTGLAGQAARRNEPSVWMVGVDPSSRMLLLVPRGALAAAVAAVAPGLPFATSSFDAVVANLSVSHIGDHVAGARDIARVLRPGGRFACTAWSTPEPDGPGNVRAEADQIVADIRANSDMDLSPPDDAVPWEDWLRDPDHLRRLLADANFDPVHVTPHRSTWTFTIGGFLSGWGSRSRYLRHSAGEERWQQFIDDASAALKARFGDHIDIINVAWIAVGYTESG
jgi:SAM-dependent methyltransferase